MAIRRFLGSTSAVRRIAALAAFVLQVLAFQGCAATEDTGKKHTPMRRLLAVVPMDDRDSDCAGCP
jgi:hypothetical protein